MRIKEDNESERTRRMTSTETRKGVRFEGGTNNSSLDNENLLFPEC